MNTPDMKLLEGQAEAAIESGDPADAQRFAQATGMTPDHFQIQLVTQGELEVARAVRSHLGESELSLRMFHASKHDFEFPSVEMLAANRENHANGALGLWVSATSDWIKGFGENLYEVVLSGKVLDVPIEQFWRWGKGMPDDYFEHKREALLGEGISYLRIIEQDGHSAMGVVVNLESIRSFNRLVGVELEAEKPHDQPERMHDKSHGLGL